MNIIQFVKISMLKLDTKILLQLLIVIYYAVNQLFTYFYIKNHFIGFDLGLRRISHQTRENHNISCIISHIIRYLHCLCKVLVTLSKSKNHLYPLFHPQKLFVLFK